MKKSILITIFLLLKINYCLAASEKSFFSGGPVFGIGTVYKSDPELRKRSDAFFGIRGTAGNGFLQGEFEFVTTKDSEVFLNEDQKTEESTNRMKLGLKFNFNLISFLDFYTRTGMQFKKTSIKTTNNIRSTSDEPEETTEKNYATYGDPYLGAGLTLYVSKVASGSIDYTLVASDFPVEDKVEQQIAINIFTGI